MKGKIDASGLMAAGVLAFLPQMSPAFKIDDLSAALGFVLWILIGLLIVKVLAIFAGVS